MEKITEEIIEKRTENSKTYLLKTLSDGRKKFAWQGTIGAIHYKDDYGSNEHWKDIDTTIQEIDGKSIVNKAPYNLEIYKDRIGFRDDSKKSGWIEIILKGNPDVSKRTIKGNQVIFEDAFPFVDVNIEAQNARIVIWKKIKKEVLRQFKYEIKKSKGEINPVVLDKINSFDNEKHEVQVIQTKTKISETSDYEVFERVENIPAKTAENKDPIYPVMVDVTIDEQVGISADDGYITEAPFFDSAGVEMRVGARTVGNGGSHDAWALFTGVSGLSGATIDVAYISLKGLAVDIGNSLTKIFADDAAAPVAPTDRDDMNTRTRTTAGVDWDLPGLITSAFTDSPSIITVIQELADSYDSSSILILHDDDGSSQGGNNIIRIATYDYASADAPKLWIEYTPAGVGTNMKINVGDVWKTVTKVEVNVGNVWKEASKVQINVGDVWKDVY